MKKADKIDALKVLKLYVNRYLGTAITGVGILAGLCDILKYASITLTDEQKEYLFRIIPKHSECEYVWKERKKAPRIKWINEQIKKLEKK